jgi:hypothetical protein
VLDAELVDVRLLQRLLVNHDVARQMMISLPAWDL